MKAAGDLAPLPGAVCLQRVRCGKSNCRCARGELHEAFYRFWNEGGRRRKAYVRRSDLERTRAACEQWRARCGWVRRSLNPGRRGFDDATRSAYEQVISATLAACLGGKFPILADPSEVRHLRV